MAQTIREVMTRDVEVIGPQDTLRDAAEKMRSLNVGALPVCQGDRVVGMLTDRDIVVRAIALGMDSASTSVEDAMTGNVQYCFEEDDALGVLTRMRDMQVRRFIVVNEDERLVGIVSLGDLSQVMSEQRVGETLEGISEPSPVI
ncbi:CBS domain-containing protein [Cystobacter ferrugineus]|uniref:Inosine-5-monophosphate dehydrogenase n=1 Tax=Cystobacter ferrugineus TaxID=83449 RepID=A0A1L9B2X0_9BACT|nr:CBS domain-containing protein [Cystobacter ferrugineus]OJH36570.1 inosine-5-monophosphate dehydrogenase [Cystobacter ferrugineus]